MPLLLQAEKARFYGYPETPRQLKFDGAQGHNRRLARLSGSPLNPSERKEFPRSLFYVVHENAHIRALRKNLAASVVNRPV
jgi:hypothetical protein